MAKTHANLWVVVLENKNVLEKLDVVITIYYWYLWRLRWLNSKDMWWRILQACHYTLKITALKKIKVNPDTTSFRLEDKIESLNSQLMIFPDIPIPI